ncbi:uncharacterized protein BXIN_2696 [Babesia sp. Xinjiang]|uniref:uncharacterized protein n=1 Tax=Babesia sp. Xinjiang TaxID=462227 RepID=UPI000A22CDB6|nr:uncharacterized protein BXIN_2624 [Babesia sp. Xinjiang]XP_028872101.1 uncharacterized protein BXIN_2696 [Babesia sp. Xinjiang]ORM41594.1 hypothetical protein BXIN_2624 [Babesia sp. Xinjiang]ORM41645.1 hypothetical protein BXIN_2696 [Babesia sp. Xinjiang]
MYLSAIFFSVLSCANAQVAKQIGTDSGITTGIIPIIVYDRHYEDFCGRPVNVKPKKVKRRKCVHRYEPEIYDPNDVYNVEDPDKRRRPHYYQSDILAARYTRRMRSATKAVVIVGFILLGIAVISAAMACCRAHEKVLIPL